MKLARTRLPRLVSAALAGAILVGTLAGTSPAFAAFHSPSDFNRALVMMRARNWFKRSPNYSQTRWYNGYRTDCSGFVSMAWGLGQSYVTWTLPAVAWKIHKSDLTAGDIMLDYTGPSKHVVLFDHWANSRHTAYWDYELSHSTNRVVHRIVPYPFWTGDRNEYLPYRFARSPRYSGKQAAAPAPKVRTLSSIISTVSKESGIVTPAVAPAPKPIPVKPSKPARTAPLKPIRKAAAPARRAPAAAVHMKQRAVTSATQRRSVSSTPAARTVRHEPRERAASDDQQLNEPVALTLARGLVGWITR